MFGESDGGTVQLCEYQSFLPIEGVYGIDQTDDDFQLLRCLESVAESAERVVFGLYLRPCFRVSGLRCRCSHRPGRAVAHSFSI